MSWSSLRTTGPHQPHAGPPQWEEVEKGDRRVRTASAPGVSFEVQRNQMLGGFPGAS